MATVTHYGAATSTSTSNVDTYASASFSPDGTGELLVVSVICSGTVDAGAVTASANGVSTFTRVDRAVFGPSIHSVYIFVADQLTTGTSAMTVTFDCTGDTGSGAIVMVAGVVGMTKTGATAILQSDRIDDGAGSTTPEFVFPAACQTGNVTLYALGEISSGGVLTPTGWTEGVQQSYSTPTIGGAYGYRASGFTGTTVTWPGTETAHGGVIVELDTSGSGTDGTATPAVIALTSTMPAVTTGAGSSASPAVIAAPVTMPAATLSGGGTSSPTAVALTVAMPAPTATGGGTATPAVITVPVTMPAVTTGAGSSASPAVIPVTISLPAATASGSDAGTATPAVIACTAALPAATATGSGTATPATVALSVTLPSATIRGSGTATPVAIPVTLTTPGVTTGAGASASPNAIALVAAIPNPGISAGATVNPATIALAITLAAATASGNPPDPNPITVTVYDLTHTVTVYDVQHTATVYPPRNTITVWEHE